MSEYTTESPASVAARQRRRRSLLTIGVVLLGLFFAFWYGLSYYEADQEARAAKVPPTPTCRPYDPEVLTPGDVTVNVYNATSRTGLAGSTSRLVADRGFLVGKVANDPSKRKTPPVAEVRHGPKGAAAAELVAAVMPKGTTVVADKRKDATVDIALGTTFKTLLPATEPTGAPMCPAPTVS